MRRRRLSNAIRCAFLGFLAAAAPAAAQEVPPVQLDPPESSVTTRWGVGLAGGSQRYGNDDTGTGSAGTVGAVQLTYRALVDDGEGAAWLFELGFEHARSLTDPEVAPGVERTIRSNSVFYRFSRYIGQRLYIGGRAGVARVRGPVTESNVDLVLGLQAGVTVARWLDAGVEVVAADPSGAGGQPLDVRGVVTVSF
ncbi:hypothetical protein QWY84_06985 [Aquisalimonas lutea]|uniref:hypothetical protein n=1 Tax=Aquisalimonas lutea TaxID=1327750 RepID=UPI0025B55C8C|nr:hypothetical protein [Aquisalimonas lutea]MDN3517346.1 hypothetical protein [Aquisalimonas lutea]